VLVFQGFFGIIKIFNIKIEKKYYRQERKNKVKRKNDAGVWNRSFVKQNWKRGL